MGKVATRDLQKEAAWRRRLSRHAESGQSVRAWCRTHGVTETAFYWWRRELARRDAAQKRSARRGAGRQAASFVPVHVTEAPARVGGQQHEDQRGAAWQIEIVLTDGRRVRLTGPVSQQMLTAVLEALASADFAAAERRAC